MVMIQGAPWWMKVELGQLSDMARVTKCLTPLSRCEDYLSLFLRSIQSLIVIQELQNSVSSFAPVVVAAVVELALF